MMNTYTPPKSAYIPVISKITGRLLFKIDITRGIIEIQDRGNKEYVDLGMVAQEKNRPTDEVYLSVPHRSP